MRAVVVYESLWGNTAAIARAIAEGLSGGTRALSTGEATAEALADCGLIVTGSPVLAIRLPTEEVRESIRTDPGPAPSPPDLSHPPMRSCLESLPHGEGHCAAFDTQVRGPFGKAAPAILRALEKAGYRALTNSEGVHRHRQVRTAARRRDRASVRLGRLSGDRGGPVAGTTTSEDRPRRLATAAGAVVVSPGPGGRRPPPRRRPGKPPSGSRQPVRPIRRRRTGSSADRDAGHDDRLSCRHRR